MNLRKITITFSALLIIASQSISAEPVTIGDVEMGNDSKSKAFEQVKKKLGKWEGTMTQGLTGAVFDVSYEFKLTSGGNTITETLVEDGVEMLTTYSDNDGKLVIKHYCGLGTEPIFEVDKLTGKSMSIKLDQSKLDGHFFYDVIYNPPKTKFLENAKKSGIKTENGKSMFIYQAMKAFEIWNGIRPEINKEVLDLIK